MRLNHLVGLSSPAATTVPRLFLGLAIHNHQPVGNFDWVFRDAYQRAYLPFLEALERHPGVRLSLHYTGPLLDWLRDHEPAFLERLRALVDRGQVELMGGGYYEPILPVIPDADKRGQIGKMRQVLQDWLGRAPTGLWLAERVWEPHLPRWLAEAGVEWTVLDDAHFLSVGLTEEELGGYFLTEEQGKCIKLFATSRLLRHVIPFRPVEEVLDHLRSLAALGEPRLAVMGDDGEKFGVWPDTYRACWENGWIDAFFSSLVENATWLQTTTLGDFAQRFPPRGRVYIPSASYSEMLEWALPPAASARFHQVSQRLAEEGNSDALELLRGGFWRAFMVKYPEANAMHKKMLLVHEKVQQAGGAGQEALWRAQCNCPYWHGIFGGIYMNDIRVAAYQNLVAAERAAEERLHHGRPRLAWRSLDYDCDGWPEVLVEGSPMSLYVAPRQGGSILEWDWLPEPLNLVATMTRRREAYHASLLAREPALQTASTGDARSIHEVERAKEPELGRYLAYDRYQRLSLLDHFLPRNTRLAALQQATYEELGDFLDQPYDWEVLGEGEALRLRLWREGVVRVARATTPVRIEKELRLERGSERLDVSYSLTSLGERRIDLVFATEWNLNLLGGGSNPLAYVRRDGQTPLDEARLDSAEEQASVRGLVVGNRGLNLQAEVSLTTPAHLWRYPIETISSSESGIERVHQGFCLLLGWPVALQPGESWKTRLAWRLSAAAAKMT